MSRYFIPARPAETEIEILKSRFIARAAPVFNVEEARTFIQSVHSVFPDATHHVPAYRIGFGASEILHCSDDGEPSGTAGRPVLAVVKGSGFGDLAVVITRYFGGIKLGTGGLVRAYTEAAQEVIAILPKAEKVATHTVLFVVPYSLFERARLLVHEHAGTILDEDFAADITLSAQFLTERFPAFQDALKELSRGSIQAEIIETNPETILPLE